MIDGSQINSQVLAALQPLTIQGGKFVAMAPAGGGDNSTQILSLTSLSNAASAAVSTEIGIHTADTQRVHDRIYVLFMFMNLCVLNHQLWWGGGGIVLSIITSSQLSFV